MDKPKILLIGAGGHAKVILSILRKLPRFEIAGLVDVSKPPGLCVFGAAIIGTDHDLARLRDQGIEWALIAVGSVQNNTKRFELFEKARKIGFRFPAVVSPDSTCDESATIKEGTVVMPHVVINADAAVGTNCIINTGAIIEHDCRIGDHCHIAPGAHLSGEVKIGDFGFIGVGSTIIQGTIVGNRAAVGAGSVVTKDVPAGTIVIGNPARPLQKK